MKLTLIATGLASVLMLLSGSAVAQTQFYYTSAEQKPVSVDDVLKDESAQKDDCSQKDDCCGLGKGCVDAYCSHGDPWELFPETCSGIKIGGWTQFGYTSQSTGLMNSHPDKVNLHQQWMYIEKKADGSCGWDWGFRGDVLYGVDAQDDQAFGSNPGTWDFLNGFDHGIYGWAFPEAFVEVANGDLSVKVGKFGTLIGYEYVSAPDNFFFSHDFGFFNSEPFTHTGALATYGATDRLEVYAGWTLGWDTGFDRYRDGSSFLGGFSYDVTDCITFTYITTFGDFGWRGKGYNHSLVFDVALTEKLNYVAQSDHMATNGTWDVETDQFFEGIANDDIDLNQYLVYSLNDCWGVGTRVEWWQRDGNEIYAATAGVNWKPHANFRLRPEIRYQWGDPSVFKDFDIEEDQWIFGVDAVVTY